MRRKWRLIRRRGYRWTGLPCWGLGALTCGGRDEHAVASTEMTLLRSISAACFSLYHSIVGNERQEIKAYRIRLGYITTVKGPAAVGYVHIDESYERSAGVSWSPYNWKRLCWGMHLHTMGTKVSELMFPVPSRQVDLMLQRGCKQVG